MEQSIFDIMTAKQIAELYLVFLHVTAILVAVAALLYTVLFGDKKD
jgi:hypothetical protein